MTAHSDFTVPSRLVPRLTLDRMDSELADLLRPRVKRLGYLGEFFQCAGAQPEALKCFYRFTECLKVALPERVTEVVALTASTYFENDYERVQHERLSLKLGYEEQWIRDVEQCQPQASFSSLTYLDLTVQALTLSVLKNHGTHSAEALDDVVRAVGSDKAIAILMLIGRYAAHALMVNCLGLRPPVSSPLGKEK
jgi:alkylhydroperoxidase family enzyme